MLDFWIFLIFFCIFLSFFIIRPKMLKMTFFENSKFWPPPLFFNPPPPNLFIFWKPLLHCTLVPKFREISSKGVGARGQRLKNKIDPCGVNFDPSGSKITWHMCHTRMHVPCKFWVCATPLPSEIFSNALSARTRHWFVTSHLCD